jgi:hypothetical protein
MNRTRGIGASDYMGTVPSQRIHQPHFVTIEFYGRKVGVVKGSVLSSRVIELNIKSNYTSCTASLWLQKGSEAEDIQH